MRRLLAGLVCCLLLVGLGLASAHAQSLTWPMGTPGGPPQPPPIKASKLQSYGVLQPTAVAASKLQGYAVLDPCELCASKLQGYAVLNKAAAGDPSSLLTIGVSQ